MIRRLRHKPLAMISLTWIAVLVLVSVLAPWIAPDRPDQQDIASAFQGPSSAHWLGTGQLGLDVLSRLVYGGRVSLASTAVSVIAYALVGIPFGLLAGYRSGWVDRIILRVSDIAYAIPGAVIVLVVLAIRPNDETAAMIALGLLAAPSLARVVRSATIAVREELYIRSARVAGLRDLLILRKHVLPSVLSTVIVQVALFSTAAIGLETGLGFLGVGTTQVSWGQLIAEASANLSVQPWLLVPSGLLVVSFILALGLLGDGLRDAAAEAHAGPPPLPRGQGSPPARPAVTSAADETLPTHAPILQVADLAVQFEGRSGGTRQVLGGIHLSVARGEKVGIVGESGSGKSVTVAAILGLLPGTGRTTQGTITFDEVALAATDTAALARLRGRRISMISQNPVSGLDPAYTVRFQLAEAVRAATDLRGDDVDRRVVELLRSVQLPDPERVAASYPHQLSGGMAQRVGIAAALAGSPDLILADEPTTALDVTVQAEILEVLRGLDAAVILVTHDWGVLAQLCTRALVMYAGQIVEEGAVDTLLSAARHPYTEGLLRSNPAGAERGSVLPAIPGTVPPVELWPVGCRFADRCPLVQDACRAEPVRLVRTDGGRSLSRCRRHELVGAAGTQVWQAEHAPALRPAGGRTERPIVQVRNLTVTYRQGRSALTAVDRVDLSLAPGRTLGLVGESGSGKSTIGAAILGLVPPAAGEVLLDGEPVDRASRAERQAFSTRVQAVFQDPFGSMNPTRPVGASITEALRYTLRLDSDEIARRTSGVLHEVGLADDILQRYPSQLSGGQLQRLAIARALVVDPDFVVCDEAVSALDLSVQAQVVNLFQRLAAARGLSYLFISHDLSVVAHISDDIAVLFAGQVMEYGPATTVATQPAHPYTRNLVRAVPTPARTPTAGRSMPTGGRPAVSPTADPRSLTGCPYAQRCPAATQVCRTDRPELLSRGMGVRVACHHHDELMTSDEEVVGSHVP